MENVVVVKQPTYENMSSSIDRLMQLANVNVNTVKTNRFIIKINICGLRGPETGALTHPLLVDALLSWLRTNFGDKPEIFVVESNASTSLPSLYVEWFGYNEILSKYNAKFLNLSECPGSETIKQGVLEGQIIPDIFHDSYFISLAKLKTHGLTKFTCILKNQFGCIPYQRKVKFHPYLDEAIVEANKYFKPDLSIVDAVVVLTSVQGPGYGIPVNAGFLIASKDPVACDAVCAKMLGFNPFFITHIRLAKKRKIGSTKCRVIGDTSNNKIDAHWGRIESFVNKGGMIFLNRARKKVSQW